MAQTRQLTLDILPHKSLRDRGDTGILDASLRLSGALSCPRDLNAGDRLIVTVATADGEVLAHHYAEVAHVFPKPIRVKDLGIVGTERIHTAEVSEAVDDARP